MNDQKPLLSYPILFGALATLIAVGTTSGVMGFLVTAPAIWLWILIAQRWGQS